MCLLRNARMCINLDLLPVFHEVAMVIFYGACYICKQLYAYDEIMLLHAFLREEFLHQAKYITQCKDNSFWKLWCQ